ncbi:MAG: MFS transporter [Bacteroidales bacterium]|nr:MFS transporter [Bacteroidales bacterium]
MINWLKISGEEYKVFKLHFLFTLIQGIITGVFALNELVYIKDMNATNFQLSILLQLSVIIMVVSIMVNEFLRRIADKKKMLKIVALITHTPLLLLYYFPQDIESYTDSSFYHYAFLSIFFFFYLNLIITLPTINQMLKSAYTHNNFGRLYSYTSSTNKIMIMVTTLAFGFMLDDYAFSFVYVYPLMGILGVISIFLLSRIPQVEEIPVKSSFSESIRNSFKYMKGVLRSNKPFLHFEIGFMFYGFAWMISAAVIPIYFNEVFEMNHATYGFYKNGYNVFAIILLPFFGSLIGKIDARIFGAITFGSLMLFTFTLGISQYYMQYIEILGIKIYFSLIIAYGFYGVFAATMALLWFIGSAYFCKKEEAARYQSIHLSLTGFRAIMSFQIGIWMYMVMGFTFTFMAAALSLLIAVILMLWSVKK